MNDSSSRGRSGLILPIGAAILIIAGIIFLLRNFNYLPSGVWNSLFRFWPVGLILLGVILFFGNGRPLVVFLVTVFTVLIAVAAAIWSSSGAPPIPAPARPATFTQMLAGWERAEVTVDIAAGKLTIDSLPASSDQLATGEVVEGAFNGIDRSGSTAILKLKAPSAEWWNPAKVTGDWRVHLTQQVPVSLTVRTGANESDINLMDLKLDKFVLEGGATRSIITMPARAGHTSALVKAGAADIKVNVPPGVAARIKTDAGVSSIRIDTARFPKNAQYNESPDYAIAQNRIDLEIQGGLASVVVG